MSVKEIRILKTMSFDKQLIFAYLSCERMFKYYEHYSEMYNFGDPEALADTLQFIQEQIFETPCNDEIDIHVEAIYMNQPANHYLDRKWPIIGQQVCRVFWETLDFMLTRRKSALKVVSDYCVDIIRNLTSKRTYIVDIYSEYTSYHPKVLNEVVIQKSIIKYLHRIDDMDNADIQDLRLLQGSSLV